MSVPTLFNTIVEQLKCQIKPRSDGTMPYVYTHPHFLLPEQRKAVIEGRWTDPVVNSVGGPREMGRLGNATQMDVALASSGDTAFPGMPSNAIGPRVFVVTPKYYDPDTNELYLRVDSEIDMSFWLEIQLPIE